MKIIELTRGLSCIVDDDVYTEISHLNWFGVVRDDKRYACRMITNKETGNREMLYMHRVIMNAPKGMYVDHIGGNGLDNRRENLRTVSSSQNAMNRSGAQKNSKSGVRGVSWSKERKKWVAQIRCGGVYRLIGRFATKKEAHEKYIEANAELFGEHGGSYKVSM